MHGTADSAQSAASPAAQVVPIYFDFVCPLVEPLGLVVLPEAPELLEPLLEGLVVLPDAPELLEGWVCELVLLPAAPLFLK